MNRKRLLVGKKNSDLYNNIWGSSNAQAITTKFLYNLELEDLDEKQGCQCREPLLHISCRVWAIVYTWKGRKYFVQDGFHDHTSSPVNIHLNPDKEV